MKNSIKADSWLLELAETRLLICIQVYRTTPEVGQHLLSFPHPLSTGQAMFPSLAALFTEKPIFLFSLPIQSLFDLGSGLYSSSGTVPCDSLRSQPFKASSPLHPAEHITWVTRARTIYNCHFLPETRKVERVVCIFNNMLYFTQYISAALISLYNL